MDAGHGCWCLDLNCLCLLQEEHCDFFDWYDAKFEQRPLKVIRMFLDETEMMHGNCVDDGCDDGRSFWKRLMQFTVK